jgi:26S proteasome regulatory subunit N9
MRLIIKDPKAAIEFLTGVGEKVKEDKSAYVLAIMETAHYQLHLKDLVATQQAIESSQKTLDTLDGVDPVVHASFYRVSAEFHKVS